MRAKYMLAAGLALLPAVALANETTRYGYDAKGRLVVADSRRPNQGGEISRYSYDPADNRVIAIASGPLIGITLAPGSSLALGQGVISADGRFVLNFQSDGNLVLLDQNDIPLWASGTQNLGGTQAAMQSDGNLVVYAGQTALWHTGTYGHPGAVLNVQTDGNAVIYDAASAGGAALWASNTCCR